MSNTHRATNPHFDYSQLKRRLDAASGERLKKEREEDIAKHLFERAERARRLSQPKKAASNVSKLAEFLGSAAFWATMAGMLAVGVIGVSCALAYGIADEKRIVKLNAQCRANSQEYVSDSKVYCSDERRFAHVINGDGSTDKPAFDWRINAQERRLQEYLADHGKLPVNKF
jgi:hypothetical protein